MTPPLDTRPIRSFGRTRSRTIKPKQADRLVSLLPRVELPDPSLGFLDVRSLAPAAREVWFEIGFGGGEHMAAQAKFRPDVLILGAEPFQNGVASALGHIEALSLGNVRLHAGDARDLMRALPDQCIDRLFILFPDPWPKLRHHKRRLINQASVEVFARILKPGAVLRFAPDWADYGQATLECFLRGPHFSWVARRADDWRSPPDDHVPTRYEAKGLGDIKPLFLEFLRE